MKKGRMAILRMVSKRKITVKPREFDAASAQKIAPTGTVTSFHSRSLARMYN